MSTTTHPITISRPSLTTANNDLLTLPDDLRQQLTTALFDSPSSIPAIQTALVSAFQSSGFSNELERYVLEILRHDSDSVPSETQVLELVIEKLRQNLKEEVEGGRNGKQKATGDGNLKVPGEVLDAGTRAVKNELQDNLRVQIEDDEEDWT